MNTTSTDRMKIKDVPLYPFIPLVPVVMLVASLTTSISALMCVRRLERRLMAALGV